ncbi:NUDIX hydrolase [Comamonadaceae bacterium PP-2]
MSAPHIRAKALCIFSHHGKILVSEAVDPAGGTRFCRPLGGSIEFGETSARGIVREIREELDAEIVDLRLIGTLENIFTYQGELGHEIVQVYDAAFADRSFYGRASISGVESNGQSFSAFWLDPAELAPDCLLVPDGLLQLLTDR